MKKLAFSLIAGLALAGTSFAGHEMVSSKEYKTPVEESCFKDQELQIDTFGSYTDFTSHEHCNRYHDGFGGGLGINYFFTKYIGVGVDGNVLGGDAHGVWTTTGSVIFRYPIEGSICLAPYAFGGGGGLWDGTSAGSGHAGGGLEWRVLKQKLGVYGEGRYTWGGADTDAAQARFGVRFVF